MRKLAEVEEATALMTEAAINWSVLKWLREKKRVRKAADKANNALWAVQKELKAAWADELQAAYAELAAHDGKSAHHHHSQAADISAETKALAAQVKKADEEADRVHQDAEDTFDKAEKILSTSTAREGARKAILSWELYEKAIAKAESAVAASRNTK